MKTNRMLIAAVAAMAMSLFAGTAQAQYRAVGDDGIAASPRLRERLDEYTRNQTPAITPAAVTPMACPTCKDKVTERIDYTARGANKPVVRVATHQCEGCSTHWTFAGVGKARHAVASHTCTVRGIANCDTTSK